MPSDHQRVADAIAQLSADPSSSLESLAASAQLSPAHFQRMFRRLAGVSPKRLSQSLRVDRAERSLEASRSVLEAAADAEVSGPGRLHDLTVALRAMSPGELRRGGEGLQIRVGVHMSALGRCAVALTPRGVCEVAFDAPDLVERLRARWPRADVVADPEAGRALAESLVHASERAGPLTLHVRGTNFQLRVWKALLAMTPGQTTSYGALASELGRPTAARAVGQAVGANPVAVLIPCHRVLRAHGALGGYRWGLERKRVLLALER